jgi:hypothetical protein
MMFNPSLESKESHPVYMSVTEINYDVERKNMGMVCKIFINDFEFVLKKYHKGVDLLNPSNKKISDQWIDEYIQKNLKISLDQKRCEFKYLGFEREDDALMVFYESPKINSPKQLVVENTLLYDFKKEQMNIVHVEINGERKSRKLTQPDISLKFDF